MHHLKQVVKASLGFVQQFRFVNFWFRFLMSRTGYKTTLIGTKMYLKKRK